MTTSAATVVLLLAAVCGAVIATMIGPLLVRKRAVPHARLVGFGFLFLTLAAVHIALGAAIPSAQRSGPWADGTITALPGALGLIGSLAFSAWIARWNSERSRGAGSIDQEIALVRDLSGVLVGLERELRPVGQFWLGVTSPAVDAGEELIYGARRAAREEDLDRFIFRRGQGLESSPVALPRHIEHQAVALELRSGDAWRALEMARARSADLIDALRSLQVRIPLDDDLSSLGAEVTLLDFTATSESFDLALLLLIAAGAERVRSGDPAFPPDLLLEERAFEDVEEVVEASRSRRQSAAKPAGGSNGWAGVLKALRRLSDDRILPPMVGVPDRQIADAQSRWDAFVDAPTQRNAWLDALNQYRSGQAPGASRAGPVEFWQQVAASVRNAQRRAGAPRHR